VGAENQNDELGGLTPFLKKSGILLMNLGSPKRAERAFVGDYLKDFLMDPRVLDLPYFFRLFLVRGIIVPFRSKKTALAYQKIWTSDGAPLSVFSQKLAATLPNTALGMAFGEPSIEEAVEQLLESGVEELLLFPLFPQEAAATRGICIQKAMRVVSGRIPVKVVPPFYEDPAYIRTMADSISDVPEHLLFSYHALPLRQLDKMAPPHYQQQCIASAHAIARAAHRTPSSYSISFQSKMGWGRWTQPATSTLLRQLPRAGKTRLAVVCPGFFCDNLETLEEIKIRGKRLFLQSGGESFRFIPCLNATPSAQELLRVLSF
jgi:ferrochelatase